METTEPVIDIQATNAKFDELCISRSAWARKHLINPAVFYQRLSGQLKITPEIAALLRADNILVEH